MEYLLYFGGVIALIYLIFKPKKEKKGLSIKVTCGDESKEIEIVDKPKKKQPHLKNKQAELLRNEKTITLDGIEINLWQSHSSNSINTQNTWNKIQSYTELNENSTGESGNIVITGVFQIPRKEAAAYAVKLGFNVRSGVSKFTDYIVIGSENVSPSKIAKAIEINNKHNNKIKFIEENTFLELVLENHIL